MTKLVDYSFVKLYFSTIIMLFGDPALKNIKKLVISGLPMKK